MPYPSPDLGTQNFNSNIYTHKHHNWIFLDIQIFIFTRINSNIFPLWINGLYPIMYIFIDHACIISRGQKKWKSNENCQPPCVHDISASTCWGGNEIMQRWHVNLEKKNGVRTSHKRLKSCRAKWCSPRRLAMHDCLQHWTIALGAALHCLYCTESLLTKSLTWRSVERSIRLV
jgi:hypothetical protein